MIYETLFVKILDSTQLQAIYTGMKIIEDQTRYFIFFNGTLFFK
jgi:hypothetical protein